MNYLNKSDIFETQKMLKNLLQYAMEICAKNTEVV